VEPNGEIVPPHFHITEVGRVDKHFIDCGGTIRKEARINFQLFTADDIDHRLSAQKLRDIILLSEKHLPLGDQEIEVEYQAGTIGKFGLTFDGTKFHLTNTQTACLASEACGIKPKKRVSLRELTARDSCC
jgi:hypothetical protein